MNSLNFDDVFKAAAIKIAKTMMVSGSGNNPAVKAVLQAQDMGLVKPIFCGIGFSELNPESELLFPGSNTIEARRQTLEMVANGAADIFLDTDPLSFEFLRLISDKGLVNGRITSYVSICQLPKENRLTLLTDTLVNPAPELTDKITVLENAISVADALGIQEPKIAALAPLELVNPAIRSTVDAAVLSKMSQRGQFGKATVEGPLAMDNAESAAAARHKGIQSPVPGDVDIYFFPDIESANITAQFLSWVFRAKFAGILAGARVPMVVASPLEPDDSWLVNIALAVLMCG